MLFPTAFTDVLDTKTIKYITDTLGHPHDMFVDPRHLEFEGVPGYPDGLFLCKCCVKKIFDPSGCRIPNIPLVRQDLESPIPSVEVTLLESSSSSSSVKCPVYSTHVSSGRSVHSKKVPAGSLKQKDWKISVPTNGKENVMWINLCHQKVLLGEMEKQPDPSIWSQFIPSIDRVFEIEMKNMKSVPVSLRLTDTQVLRNARSILDMKVQEEKLKIESQLLDQDLSDLSPVKGHKDATFSNGEKNVYADYVLNSGASFSPYFHDFMLHYMYVLTKLYFTQTTFPAWRAVFYTIWKHARTPSQRKQIANIVLRRVLWCSYTVPIFKLMSEDLVLLSLYDHSKMASKKVHQQRMQIYEANYEAIKKIAVSLSLKGKTIYKMKKSKKIGFRVPREHILPPQYGSSVNF